MSVDIVSIHVILSYKTSKAKVQRWDMWSFLAGGVFLRTSRSHEPALNVMIGVIDMIDVGVVFVLSEYVYFRIDRNDEIAVCKVDSTLRDL